ncbi:MAG: 16S rRNA (cytosine(1402)-N(4))-methyltransferase RsmH [Lentisphaeria bacterium]|nr:16S rRNA (cytosine(1402)-N(4))-methyltransferase RsmH [Lentisphaeria bacterium]
MTEQTSLTHIPVLAEETVRLLTGGRTSGAFHMIDCTLGCGGHSSLVLKQDPDAEVLALDRDPQAIVRGAAALEFAAERVFLRQTDFAGMKKAAADVGWDQADAILMDLGVSSPQIDDPKRGFSYRFDGPLDMRMDGTAELTAARVLNTYPENELERVFREYGEIREARQLARAIVEDRKGKPFETTFQFAGLCDRILRGKGRKGGLPAPTLPFQALRIEVNDEIGQLRRALDAALELLAPGGILAVISFHSLEDRIVKHFMAEMAVRCKCPPDFPVCVCGWKPKLEVLTKKPLTATEAELRSNPRAACAKLRAARKIEDVQKSNQIR